LRKIRSQASRRERVGVRTIVRPRNVPHLRCSESSLTTVPSPPPGLFMRNDGSVGNEARCGHFIQSHFGVFRHSVVSAKASKMRSNPHPDCVSRVWPAKLMNNPGSGVGYVVKSLRDFQQPLTSSPAGGFSRGQIPQERRRDAGATKQMSNSFSCRGRGPAWA
jgi:hypothetical protein